MKKFFLLVCVVFILTGCASLQLPAYVQDKHPYVQRFYGEHQEVVEAAKKGLGDFGWQVEGTADPSVYEQNRIPEPGSENILLFTQVRQAPMFLWTSYFRLNVFISSKNKTSDVEIRYSKVKSFSFKGFKGYRNDKLIKQIFQRITDYLNQS